MHRITLGLAIAIVGVAMGFVGGAIGTYASIARTTNERERRFVIVSAAVLWAAVLALVAVLAILPAQYASLLLAAYGISLPFVIRFITFRQARLREGNSEEQP